MTKISTDVTLTFTDQETGKTRSRKMTNVAVTLPFILKTTASSTNRATNWSLMVSNTPVGPTKNSVAEKIRCDRVASKQAYSEFKYLESTPILGVERNFRFTGTGSSENITAVVLTLDSSVSPNGNTPLAYFPISPSESQGATETLDIKYRINFIMDDALTPSEKALERKLLYKTITNNSSVSLHNTSYTTRLHYNENLNNKWRYRAGIFGKEVDVMSAWANSTNFNYAPNENRGTLVRSIGMGFNTTSTWDIISGIGAYKPFINKALYPSYPLAPLFSHRPGSYNWFENVSFLATGSGQPIVEHNSPEWSTDLESDIHVLNIVKEGQTGTARYDISVIGIYGGFGTNSQHSSLPADQFQYVNPRADIAGLTRDQNPEVLPYVEATEMHDFGNDNSLDFGYVYNGEFVVMTSNNGLCLAGATNNELVVYDKGTVPALPASYQSIHRSNHSIVCRDNAGSLYIGAGTGGLVKITNPLDKSTAVVSQLSLSSIGITGAIIAIAHGANDRIWILEHGVGVHYSDDQGANWTIQSAWSLKSGSAVVEPTATSIPANVRGIICDPNKPHEMALIFKTSNETSFSYCWYDGSTNEVMGMGSQSYFITTDMRKGVACSDFGSMWVNTRNWSAKRSILKWGETVLTGGKPLGPAGHTTMGYHKFNIFMYDRYNNPYILVEGGIAAETSGPCTLVGPDGDKIGRIHVQVTTPTGTWISLNEGYRYDYQEGKRPSNGYIRKNVGINNTPYYYQLTFTVSNFAPHMESIYMGLPGPKDMLNMEVLSDQVFRWDNANSEWKEGFNAPASESGDGSVNLSAERFGFMTDDQKFSGRSRIDLTPIISGKNLSTAGFSLVAAILPGDKKRHSTNPTTPWYTHAHDYDMTICSIHNSATKRTVDLVWRDKSDNIVIIDNTTDTEVVVDIGVTPANAAGRVVLTLSPGGTVAKAYLNGTLIGNVTLAAPLDITNTADELELSLGSKLYNHDILDTHYINHFYMGEMSNVQLWETELSAARITTDQGNHAGLISPSTELLARYMLDEDPMEGRVTSATPQIGPYNLSIAMPDGATGTSYVEGEYYNVASIKDGYLLDNVSDLSVPVYLHSVPLEKIVTATDTSNDTSVIPSAARVVTEPVVWATNRDMADIRTGLYFSNDNLGNSTTIPYRATAWSSQSSNGADFSVEFEITALEDSLYFAFTPIATMDHTVALVSNSSFTVSIGHRNNGNAQIYSNNGNQSAFATGITAGDKLKMEYTVADNICRFFKWDEATTAYVLLSSQTINAPASDFCFGVQRKVNNALGGSLESPYCGSGIADIKITRLAPASQMSLGDVTSETGIFKGDHYDIPAFRSALEVNVDGTPFTVLQEANQSYGANIVGNGVLVPSQGEVIFLRKAGVLVFNDADQGGAVTVGGDCASRTIGTV